jgi:hypothetical protein
MDNIIIMPFKDPEKGKAYNTAWRRQQRAKKKAEEWVKDDSIALSAYDEQNLKYERNDPNEV